MWGHFHHASKDTDIFRRPKVLAAIVSISRFSGRCVILPGCGSFWSWWPMSSIAKLSTTNSHLGFPGGASSKEPADQCRRRERLELNPWVRKIPWRRDGMATHSRALSWRIPWTEELGGLQSMGLWKLDLTEASEHKKQTRPFHVILNARVWFLVLLLTSWGTLCASLTVSVK